MRLARALVAALALGAGFVAGAEERKLAPQDYGAEAADLLQRLAVSVTVRGRTGDDGDAGDPYYDPAREDRFVLSQAQYKRAMSRSTHRSGLPRRLASDPGAMITVYVDVAAYVVSYSYLDLPLLSYGLARREYAQEVSELLEPYAAAPPEANPYQGELADYDKIVELGKDRKDSCTKGEPACRALALALSPTSTTTLSLAAPDPAKLKEHCASYQEPSYQELSYSCLARRALAPAMVADHLAAARGGDLRPFIHLGGYAGEERRATELIASYRLELADLGRYRSVRVVLQDPAGLLSLAVNETAVPLGQVRRQRICYREDQQGCQLQLAELGDGVELLGLLVAGTNHLALMQQGPRAATDGILLRLVPSDAAAPAATPLCPATLAANCAYREGEVCLEELGGVCARAVRSYGCLTLAAQKPGASCKPKKCEGPRCPQQKKVAANADVSAVLAKLEALRQMAVYMDKDAYSVFAGARGTCRSKIAWGLSSCCKSSGDRLATTNAVTLAQLGVSQLVRGVSALGSAHTHDVLFLADDLNDYLGNLGKGVLGAATAPSLSYYGLSVSASKGVLSFSFDPASFAVAVALSIVASLLECEQHEQVVGVKLGAGLCYQTGKWCSKRTLFFCRERTKSFCCFNSRLAKEINRQGLAQLAALKIAEGCKDGCSYNPYTKQNVSDSSACRGLSHRELEQLDFSKIDLANVIDDFSPEVDSASLERYVKDNIDAAKAAISITSSLVPAAAQ